MPTAYAELAGAGGVITVPVEPLIVTPPKLAVIVAPVRFLRFPSGWRANHRHNASMPPARAGGILTAWCRHLSPSAPSDSDLASGEWG